MNSNNQVVSIRYKYEQALLREGDYEKEELDSMSLPELRDLYEEYNPTYVSSVSLTMSGGVSKRMVPLKKVA